MTTLAAQLSALGARPVRETDAPFLARLYASTRPDLLGDGSADPVFAAALMAMQQRLQSFDYRARFPGAEAWVLEQDGAPCARFVLDGNAERLRLVDIAVLPEARGRGAGTRILRALQHWAGSQGVALALSVQRSNARARRLYLSLGFVPAGADSCAEELRWGLS